MYCIQLSTAPLDETVDHFWRMVWEYEIEAIVMLTNCVEMGRVSLSLLISGISSDAQTVPYQEKSAQYWPEGLNETITPGDRLSVSLSALASVVF